MILGYTPSPMISIAFTLVLIYRTLYRCKPGCLRQPGAFVAVIYLRFSLIWFTRSCSSTAGTTLIMMAVTRQKVAKSEELSYCLCNLSIRFAVM
jgi:hypothetical protein